MAERTVHNLTAHNKKYYELHKNDPSLTSSGGWIKLFASRFW